MKKIMKLVLSLVLLSFVFNIPVYAAHVPEGAWNYVNGVWVKVELPDNDSPYDWVPGYWKGNTWVPGHWKQVEPVSAEAVKWVPAHWTKDGKWVPGHWNKVEVVSGQTWIPGHWKNGKWIPGYWTNTTIKGKKARVWVPEHRNPAGKWVPGHWETR